MSLHACSEVLEQSNAIASMLQQSLSSSSVRPVSYLILQPLSPSVPLFFPPHARASRPNPLSTSSPSGERGAPRGRDRVDERELSNLRSAFTSYTSYTKRGFPEDSDILSIHSFRMIALFMPDRGIVRQCIRHFPFSLSSTAAGLVAIPYIVQPLLQPCIGYFCART